jgi:VanZ family protein
MVTRLAPERRRNLMSGQWLLLAALALAAIAFVTLCPMPLRPRWFANPDMERFVAFAALGFAAKLAFPRRHLWTVLGLVMVAVGLEAAQSLAPGRDAHLRDAVVKAIGAAIGVQFGLVSLIARRALSRRLREGLEALAPS